MLYEWHKGALYTTASYNGRGFVEVFQTFDDVFGYGAPFAKLPAGVPAFLLDQANTEFGSFSMVLLPIGAVWILSVNLEEA